MTETSFPFLGKIYIAERVYVDLDTAYVSNGTNDPPTIRVYGLCREIPRKGRDALKNGSGPDIEFVDCDINVGDPFYDTLLAQAEAFGDQCRACDEEADRQLGIYHREMAAAE